MADQLLSNEVTEHPVEETEENQAQQKKKCFCCLSHRTGAVLIGALVSISNILSMIVCMILLFNDAIKVYEYNEEFNYVFMTTINAIMLFSNFLIIRGAVTQQQKFVLAWVLVYGVLVFLENVVGFATFILAMVAHATAWSAVPFILLLILDGLYVYCILTAHHYCKSLQGYTVFP